MTIPLALTVAALLYGLGAAVCAFNAALGYSLNKPEEWQLESLRERYREKQLYWARVFRLSPIWPVLLVEPLRRIITDGREEPDDLPARRHEKLGSEETE